MWSATAVCDEEDSTGGYGVQRCDQTVDYCADIPTPEPSCNLQSAIDTPRALPRAEIYTQCRLAYAKRTWLDRSHSGISILLGHEPRSDR